ncbi:hypothetical protein N0V93_008013 [Gnomoniopsis smithogilvyi]|uniref:Uncharacterized protein n=1 Tax=Gnomoniopsis smithogilvyi TaxID=1191159 RepID=A0A9W9CTH5_9PEZI|nr:hypothetical protein N0V93_008013 [Gnomoniopsis smithogilvyi]
MLFSHLIFPLLAFVGLAAARKKPEQLKSWVIIHQLDILQHETQQLDKELSAWDKSLMGAMNISVQTENLLRSTRNATVSISTESPKLGILGALHVKRNTKHLIKDMRVTVGHLQSLKMEFNNVGLVHVILDGLVEQQAASKEMNDAILPKLPKIGRHTGRRLGRRISKIFQSTIEEYKKLLAADPKPATQAKETRQSSKE